MNNRDLFISFILNPLQKIEYEKVRVAKEKAEEEANLGSLPFEEAITKSIDSKNLSIEEISICRYIYNRAPYRIGDTFYNDVDSLYCFTKLRNEGIKQEVRHVWFYEDQIMTQVRYNVKKSNVYRSWTKKNNSPFQIGNWRVEIQNKRGDIIGQTSFVIKEK